MMGAFVGCRSLAVAVSALAVIASAPASGDDTHRGASAITCTNPLSGTHWQIKVDYDQSTVDSNPARISSAEISWRDANDGWNYSLDRRSGNLTVVVASSTGGSFLHDQCKPDD